MLLLTDRILLRLKIPCEKEDFRKSLYKILLKITHFILIQNVRTHDLLRAQNTAEEKFSW